MVAARTLYIGVASAALYIGVASVAVAAPAPSPVAVALSATATPDTGPVGTVTQVQGSGWPAFARLQLVTCGALAIDGSADCDTSGAYTLLGSKDGVWSAQVVVGRPPKPCPCVLQVSDANSGKAVAIPLEITGLPTAPLPSVSAPPGPSPLAVVSSRLTGWRWTELFGAGPARTLVLTVHNGTPNTMPSLEVDLADSPNAVSQHGLGKVTIGPLTGGATRTFEVPVTLGATAGGSVQLYGRVAGGPVFALSTHSWPLGLYALALLVALVALLFVRRGIAAVRQRRRGPHDDQPGPSAQSVVAAAR